MLPQFTSAVVHHVRGNQWVVTVLVQEVGGGDPGFGSGEPQVRTEQVAAASSDLCLGSAGRRVLAPLSDQGEHVHELIAPLFGL